MNCSTVQNRLNAYVDGELPVESRSRIDTHLQTCQDCRRAVERLRQLSRVLETGRVPSLPEGFAIRLMVRARGQRVRPSRGRLYWTGSICVRAAAAAVLFIGLTLGALMGLDLRRRWEAEPLKTEKTAQADPIAEYGLDYLSGAPNGSMVQVYLTLTSGQNDEGD